MRGDFGPDERFAIIGIGCRLPPAGNSLAAFWRFLLKGGNALKPIKKDRWDWKRYWDEDPARPGKTYAPKGAWLDQDVRQFDPLAFGISPREAASMDPQQRLLLESTWEAFEDAGLPVERVAGSRTGVFIGGFCLDHLLLRVQPSNLHLMDAHAPGGVMMTVLSNRLSHAFDLRGPSLTLDTACSSSLVAIHYACQSLRSGEADMALAGGVNVMTRPEYPVIMSKGHFLSQHGECRAFDESAAGYARGEGAGVFLIKPLTKAVADGDPIHAVIRGSGVNSDGHTEGLSLPNDSAQSDLVREVYERAGVAPGEVDYVEAHGTGTQAGDPAELAALNQNFSVGRANPLWVGSVKTNVGHLEAAAGVAGMMKAIGVLKHRQIPKNLHFKTPNPKIPFADYNLRVVTETTDLPGPEERTTLFVGVNGFGYGGTNGHVLLESAPAVQTGSDEAAPVGAGMYPFSAASEAALRDLTGKWAFLLGRGQAGTLGDLAHSVCFRRSHLPARCVIFGTSAEELRERLISASTGEAQEGVVTGLPGSGGLAFVFTGMGPQWWAMGRELLEREPVVANAVEEVDGHFKPLAGWSIREAMLAPESESRMERTEVAQPANFALQVALVRLWESWGIRPSAVVGHSVGEVTAAYVAGVYSMEEAVLVSFHRSRLQQTTAGLGGMLAVGLAEGEVAPYLRGRDGVSVAAINSFSAVTLSGDRPELEAIAAELETAEVFQKFLRVEVAYHSPQMDPIREEILEALSALAPKPARLPLYSTVSGRLSTGEEWTADYWWKNVRQSVRFADAVSELFAAGYSQFLEIGPHPVLGNSIKECAAARDQRVAGFVSLRRKEPEVDRMRQTAAELYCAGAALDWRAFAPETGRFVAGPQYPWQRQRHWVESERSEIERLGTAGPVYLTTPVISPQPCWEVEVNRNYFPFLTDHGVQTETVFAGLGYVDAALTLNQAVNGTTAVVLDSVNFERVMVVDPAKLQYLMVEHDPEGGRFTISSRTEGEDGTLRHCRGRMQPQAELPAESLDLAKLRSACGGAVELDVFYDDLSRRGLHYGPAFRPTSEVWLGEGTYLLKLDASAVAGEVGHPLHPTIFDAAIQPILFRSGQAGLFVPFSIERFTYHARPDSAEIYAYGELTLQTPSRLAANVWLLDAKGRVLAYAHRLSLQSIDAKLVDSEAPLLHEVALRAVELAEGGKVSGDDFVILADAEDSDLDLAAALESRLPGAVTAGLDAGRRHLIVLWGTRMPDVDPVAAGLALNKKIVALLVAADRSEIGPVDVTFVTRGEGGWATSAVPAVALVAQNELANVTTRTVELPTVGGDPAEWIAAELSARAGGDVVYRDGGRHERRLATLVDQPKEPEVRTESLETSIELVVGAKGKLDSLHFEAAKRVEPGPGEIEVRVHRAGLNYKDLLKIEGRIHPLAFEDTFNGGAIGMECSGVVVRVGSGSRFAEGDRVVAIVKNGFRSYATVEEDFVVKIPDGLGMELAGVPIVFLAAYYGLMDVARLQADERVLIHHATGGVGFAAMAIARWVGAEIFATAGSDEKRESLRAAGVQHVFSSRTLDFATGIREATQGEGVDVVIGAQSGQAMHAGLGALRTGGRYVEIGKKDIAEDNGLPMRAFGHNLVFASVDMDRLALERPALVRRTLEAVFDHLAKGDFEIGPTQVFPAREIVGAFQAMARSQQMGKLLVDFSEGEVDVVGTAVEEPIVRRDGCYIVTGGTSGFGLATARWLVEQGAGKIILASRSGSAAEGMDETLAFAKARGTEVEILAVDVTDAGQAQGLVAAGRTAPFRLRGVLHGANVLDDVGIADLTDERFQRVFLPKVAGGWNLAEALGRDSELDFLVFYSSVSALIGNAGQTNYIAANAALDGLARWLRGRGVPALSVNWGALAETGIVAQDKRIEAALAAAGITGLSNAQAFGALERAIRLGRPQVGAFLIDWDLWRAANPRIAEDRRFLEMQGGGDSSGSGGVASEIRRELGDSSREQRLRVMEDYLQEVLAKTLRMAKDAVPVNRRLNEMGVDSLMVLELGLGVKERLGVSFSAMELLKGPSLQQMAAMAADKLWKN